MPFFSRIPVDKKQIEAAISRLESLSSAELRVYIERKVPKASAQLSPMERALEVFDELEMYKTAAQNAVLIYVGYKNHLCAIVGDKGIHQFVDVAYWQLIHKALWMRLIVSVIFYLVIFQFSLMM